MNRNNTNTDRTLIFHLNNGEKIAIDTDLSADGFIQNHLTEHWLATYDNSNRHVYIKVSNIAYIEVKPK